MPLYLGFEKKIVWTAYFIVHILHARHFCMLCFLRIIRALWYNQVDFYLYSLLAITLKKWLSIEISNKGMPMQNYLSMHTIVMEICSWIRMTYLFRYLQQRNLRNAMFLFTKQKQTNKNVGEMLIYFQRFEESCFFSINYIMVTCHVPGILFHIFPLKIPESSKNWKF